MVLLQQLVVVTNKHNSTSNETPTKQKEKSESSFWKRKGGSRKKINRVTTRDNIYLQSERETHNIIFLNRSYIVIIIRIGKPARTEKSGDGSASSLDWKSHVYGSQRISIIMPPLHKSLILVIFLGISFCMFSFLAVHQPHQVSVVDLWGVRNNEVKERKRMLLYFFMSACDKLDFQNLLASGAVDSLLFSRSPVGAPENKLLSNMNAIFFPKSFSPKYQQISPFFHHAVCLFQNYVFFCEKNVKTIIVSCLSPNVFACVLDAHNISFSQHHKMQTL